MARQRSSGSRGRGDAWPSASFERAVGKVAVPPLTGVRRPSQLDAHAGAGGYLLRQTHEEGSAAAASGRSIASEFQRFVIVNLFGLTLVWSISVGTAKLVFPSIGFTWHADDFAHFIGVLAPAVASYFGHRFYTFSNISIRFRTSFNTKWPGGIPPPPKCSSPGRQCRNWADSAPSAVASGRTGVPAIAVIPRERGLCSPAQSGCSSGPIHRPPVLLDIVVPEDTSLACSARMRVVREASRLYGKPFEADTAKGPEIWGSRLMFRPIPLTTPLATKSAARRREGRPTDEREVS